MTVRWGVAIFLMGVAMTGACTAATSCGAIVSDYTAPTGARGCWQYTDDFSGTIVGTRINACSTANQLGACTVPVERGTACGIIYYADNGLTADQAAQYCRDAGGVWSP